MTKRMLSKAMAGMAALALPALAHAQFACTTNANNTLTITKYTGPGGAVTIPNNINGRAVTHVGDGAFSNSTERPKSVIIPDGITSIGASAFYECSRLASVNIPYGVTNIGDLAFSGCVWLHHLTVPDGVITIGNGAFRRSGLTHLTVPDSVSDIGVGVFDNCAELASVIVGSNVTSIGCGAFYACQALKGVYFFGDTPMIDESIFPVKRKKNRLQGDSAMFKGAGNATVYRLPGAKGWGTTFCGRPVVIWRQQIQSQYDYTHSNNTVIITGYTGPGGVVTIPSTINGLPVTHIGDGAFSECASLSDLTIPDGITSIGDHAFYACHGLASVMIPSSLTSIARVAFSDCGSLEGVYFKGNAPDLGVGAFCEAKNVVIYHLPNTMGWGTTFGGRPTEIWNLQTNTATKVQSPLKKLYVKGEKSKKTSLPVISSVAAEGDAWLGVFSNHGEGFGSASLMVDKSGHGYFAASVIGFMGDWTYDTNACVLVFNYFDPGTGKDGSILFRFNKEYRDYSILGADSSDEKGILEFVTNAIPKELAEAFAKYPDAVKAERKRVQAVQDAKRLQAEKFTREEPEYQRILQVIRERPETVLSDEKFYSKEDTPSTRALRAALGDNNIHFDEKILVELLNKLPDDNHWNRAQLFARPELSSATIEQFYPKALSWGAHLNYTILANMATHSNTPRWIVEYIANSKDLPFGAMNPAQRQLKKLGTVGNSNHGTNTPPTEDHQRQHAPGMLGSREW